MLYLRLVLSLEANNPTDPSVDAILQSVKAERTDSEFLEAFEETYRKGSTPYRYEEELAERLKGFIDYLIVLCEAPTAREGLQSQAAKQLASNLISRLHASSTSRPDGDWRYRYPQPYLYGVMLVFSGFSLPQSEIRKRTRPIIIKADTL